MHNVEIQYISYICRVGANSGKYSRYCCKQNKEICGQDERECEFRKRQLNYRVLKVKEYSIEEDYAVTLDNRFIPLETILFLKIDGVVAINKTKMEE